VLVNVDSEFDFANIAEAARKVRMQADAGSYPAAFYQPEFCDSQDFFAAAGWLSVGRVFATVTAGMVWQLWQLLVAYGRERRR
jgi:hypothetical protein